jgi:hypothetical protein
MPSSPLARDGEGLRARAWGACEARPDRWSSRPNEGVGRRSASNTPVRATDSDERTVERRRRAVPQQGSGKRADLRRCIQMRATARGGLHCGVAIQRTAADVRPHDPYCALNAHQQTNGRRGRTTVKDGDRPVGAIPGRSPGAGTCDRARSAGRSLTWVTVSSRTVGRRDDPVGHERRNFACTAGVGTSPRRGASAIVPRGTDRSCPLRRRRPGGATRTAARVAHPEPYAYRLAPPGPSVHAVHRDPVRHEVWHRRRRNAPSFSSTAPFPDAVTRCRPRRSG